jgi:hypothetical protein
MAFLLYWFQCASSFRSYPFLFSLHIWRNLLPITIHLSILRTPMLVSYQQTPESSKIFVSPARQACLNPKADTLTHTPMFGSFCRHPLPPCLDLFADTPFPHVWIFLQTPPSPMFGSFCRHPLLPCLELFADTHVSRPHAFLNIILRRVPVVLGGGGGARGLARTTL